MIAKQKVRWKMAKLRINFLLDLEFVGVAVGRADMNEANEIGHIAA